MRDNSHFLRSVLTSPEEPLYNESPEQMTFTETAHAICFSYKTCAAETDDLGWSCEGHLFWRIRVLNKNKTLAKAWISFSVQF